MPNLEVLYLVFVSETTLYETIQPKFYEIKRNLNTNIMFIHFKKKYNLIFIVTLFFTVNTFAQSNSASVNESLPAKDDGFVKTSGLIASGRASGTRPNGGSVDFNHPKTEVMNIYDKDGQLWYQFSIWYDSPLFIDKNKKVGFAPFTSYNSGLYTFLLRLVAESPNWYEVEINEETRETKYILKKDQAFARRDFDDFIGGRAYLVKIDNRSTSLLDAPDGKKIDDYFPQQINDYGILEMKGDWIRVGLLEANKSREARKNGWVRWRNGRKILVGCYFNDWKT
jgi:hypothetical protein